MTKGKRKRSNPRKKNTSIGMHALHENTTGTKSIPIGKKSEKEKTIYDEFPVKTLDQRDGNQLKEIFELSNNIAGLIRDYAEKAITVKKMRLTADIIEKEKQPLMTAIAQNVYRTERDYKLMAKNIRSQAEVVEKQLILVKGQIAHRYEDYVSALIRHKRLVESVIESAKLKVITGHRPDPKTKKEEEIIFERDFDDMTDKDVTELKELNRAITNHTKKKV